MFLARIDEINTRFKQLRIITTKSRKSLTFNSFYQIILILAMCPLFQESN